LDKGEKRYIVDGYIPEPYKIERNKAPHPATAPHSGDTFYFSI
jgi:hypothetical protein